MKRILNLFLIVSSGSLLFGQTISGKQSKPHTDSSLFWMNGGVGVGTKGIALTGGFALVTGYKHVVEVTLNYMEEVKLFGPKNPEYFRSIDFLYGRACRTGLKGLFTISTGLSLFDNMRHGEIVSYGVGFLGGGTFKEIHDQGLGIPVHLQLFRTGFNHIAIGIDASANLNLVHSNLSVALVLKLGSFELSKR